MKNKGFSLIEIIIAIAILSTLILIKYEIIKTVSLIERKIDDKQVLINQRRNENGLKIFNEK